MQPRQFEKSIILFFTSSDEVRAGLMENYYKIFPPLLKKTSSTPSKDTSKIISFNKKDVTLGMLDTVKLSIFEKEFKENEYLDPTRFYIAAHGGGSDLLNSLGLSMQVSAKELAQFFSKLLGSKKTSRIHPIYISMICCENHLFAKNFQKALLDLGIYSNIKTRKKPVSATPTGNKYTLDDKGESQHKLDHSKIILYLDENNKQQEWDYKYSDKHFYTSSNAEEAIKYKDDKFIAEFVRFSMAKYSKIPDIKTLFKNAIEAEYSSGLYYFLNTEFVRENFISCLPPAKLKMPFPYEKVITEALKHNNIAVIKFLHNQGFKYVSELSSDDELIQFHKVYTRLYQEIQDLKINQSTFLNILSVLNSELKQLKPGEFIKKYETQSGADFQKRLDQTEELITEKVKEISIKIG